MTLAYRRRIAASCLLAAVFSVLGPSPADAFWFGNPGCNNCGGEGALAKGAKKNSRWPSPHVCADRRHARAPFDQMIVNGWRRQNLLGSHHFNADSTGLTQSGKLKVRWIMTQAPPEFRRVFVERSLEEGVTESRIATAQDFATLVARGVDAPQVADTHIVSEGRPASTVDFVNTKFRENMPVPTLPEPTKGFDSGQ